ncbi:MAG: YtxH domain-containing protein [Bacteroidetes bacterium]|nr:YtxH domain-containing protein [Bacteroidota bacterium]
MTDNQKFIAGLLLGAVAGAALALFMKTEKGQEILSEVQEGADKVQDELKEKLHEFDTAVNDLLSKGKAFISDLEQKSQQTGTGTGA